ncbi:MAG: hypothetical protein P0120_10600 [Nitrospira sp.]|nr:hypothetical protein [Nitrospira sp.]
MQLKPLAVTTLCIMLTGWPVFAKEKKHERAMDPQHWKIADANNPTFEMYGAHGKQKETKFLEIIYSRKL